MCGPYVEMYTRKNCEMECSSNFTRKLCGCVPFYMPRKHLLPAARYRDVIIT